MQEIGLQLKKQREEKGLTLRDIEKSTKISIRLLKSIEAGDFGALPSGLFARNFIRQYCKTIGMPSEPILEKVFVVEQGLAEFENIPEKKFHRGIIGIIVVILLVAGGFWGYKRGLWHIQSSAGSTDIKSVTSTSSLVPDRQTGLLEGGNTSETILKQKKGVDGRIQITKTLPAYSADERVGKASGVHQISNRSNISGSADSQIPNSSTVIENVKSSFPVRFEADEKCWIHLRCSDKEMDFILMKGELYTTTCSDFAVISVGNAEHIRVFVNNERVTFPAGQRVVKDFVLRKSGQNRD
ncbi:MAG: helix-turn-helix domain-containing protein [Acidobacteria bacterium]|nr:helix-turn-helix domain-containing protein [Acidobacteriota bacterium]